MRVCLGVYVCTLYICQACVSVCVRVCVCVCVCVCVHVHIRECCWQQRHKKSKIVWQRQNIEQGLAYLCWNVMQQDCNLEARLHCVSPNKRACEDRDQVMV